jgi:hypothetical protein
LIFFEEFNRLCQYRRRFAIFKQRLASVATKAGEWRVCIKVTLKPNHHRLILRLPFNPKTCLDKQPNHICLTFKSPKWSTRLAVRLSIISYQDIGQPLPKDYH